MRAATSVKAAVSTGLNGTPLDLLSAWATGAAVLSSPVQREALDMFDRGFNIGPTKPGTKQPYRWRVLVGTRIDREYIPQLFDRGAGIFVLTGRLSHNLAILDCDTREAAEWHAAEFERHGLKPWQVNTARGMHFWWLSADGELANTQGEGFEVWGSMHYTLCPPSVHPTGMIYEWVERSGILPPVIGIAALDWLPLKLRKQTRREFDPTLIKDDPLSSLSKRTREFIARGAVVGERNRRLFAAACDLAGSGFDEIQATEILTPQAIACGLRHDEIRTTIHSAYSRERTPAKPGKSSIKPAPTWARAQAWAVGHDWQSMRTTWINPCDGKAQQMSVTAQTARDVFLALCERSRRDAADVFRATKREVAELANIDDATARRALGCLCSAGLLAKRGTAANGAALYAFGNEVLHHAPSNTHWSDISGTKSNTRGDVRADVFRRGALGKTAERVLQTILPPNTPATKAEIARRAKCSRSTVTRLLGADGLPKWGLVSEVAPGRWIGNLAPEWYLADIAIKSGTAGKAAQRRERHAAERAQYASENILRAKRRYELRFSGVALDGTG